MELPVADALNPVVITSIMAPAVGAVFTPGGGGDTPIPPDPPFQAPSSPRLQLASVTASFTDPTFIAAIQNQVASKADTARSFAQNDNFTFTIPAGVTAPGAAFYWDTSISAAADGVPKFERSTDGGSTFSDVPNNAFHPSGDATANANNGRGQICYMPAGAGTVVYRITPNTAYAGNVTVNLGFRQLTSNNEIIVAVGNSTWLSGARDPRLMIAKAKAMNANYDPIWMVWNRGGSEPSSCYSEQLVPGFAAHPYVKAVVGDMSLGGAVTGGRPLGSNPSSDAIVFAQIQTNLNYVAAQSAKMYWSGVNFRSYNSTTNPPIVTAANLDDGVRPYNLYVFNNFIRSAFPYNVNTTYDLPQVDFYNAIYRDPQTNLQSDGIHLLNPGNEQCRIEAARSFSHFYTDAWTGVQYIQRMVTALGTATSTTEKTKAQAVFDGLYATASAPAIANRAALKATLDALPIGYVDPPLTGGAIYFKDAPGAQRWFDFADFEHVYSDVAGTTVAANGVKVRNAPSRINTAEKLLNGTSTASSPSYAAAGIGSRGSLRFDNVMFIGDLVSFYNAYDAAGQNFTAVWLEKFDETLGAGTVFGFGAGATNTISARRRASAPYVNEVLIGSTILQETVAKVEGGIYGYVWTYDGTTETLYRSDGVKVSRTVTKAATTSTAFRLGGAASSATFIGNIGEWGIGNVAVSETVANNILSGFIQKWGAISPV